MLVTLHLAASVGFAIATSNDLVPSSLENTWELLSDGPWKAREGLMVASVKGQMLLTGGRTIFGVGVAGGNDVWRSSDGKVWTKAPKAPWKKRGYHVLIGPNEDGCVFLIGGQTFRHFYNDVWSTCDIGESWERLVADRHAPFKGRAGAAGTMHKGKIYLAGGCHDRVPYDPGNFRKFYADVWSSVDGKTWELVTDTPGWLARSGPRLMSFNDKLFIIAGEVGFTDSTQLGDVWSSSDDGKTWSVVVSTPSYSARSGHGVVAYGNYMILIAGWPELSDIYYTEDGADWTKSSGLAWNCNNITCGKYDFWPVIHDTKLFLIGGSGSSSTFGKLYSETWSLDLPPQDEGFVAV